MSSRGFALVTGCGKGGIGHALVAKLRAANYDAIATLLPHEPEEHLAGDGGIHVVRVDVVQDSSVQALKNAVEVITGGRLDILINNAGICYTMPAVDSDVAQIERMFAVNVFGPMRIVRHLHPYIIHAKGVIVNIGSIGGVCPYVYGAAYNASKAALHHFGNTLRVELRPFGIRVVNIISGEVHTNILKNDHGRSLPQESFYYPLNEAFQAHLHRTPDGITPDEYATAVVKEILRKAPVAWFWFGASTSVIRFIDTFLPRTFWDIVFSRMFQLDQLVNGPGAKVKPN